MITDKRLTLTLHSLVRKLEYITEIKLSFTEKIFNTCKEIFHYEGDIVRLGCKLGWTNGVGKQYVGAECKCAEGSCGFALNNPDFICVPEETAMMPIWTGGVFNFIREVFQSYFVIKERGI